MKYPKIETLYNRNPKTLKVIPDELRCSEFRLIKRWHITEKINGKNVRIALHPDGRVVYLGRTDKAQFCSGLTTHLETTLPQEKVSTVIKPRAPGVWPPAVLFGEGYGSGIRSGGVYRTDIAFRLFDVWIDGWWLNWPDVVGIAEGLGVKTVPTLYGHLARLPSSAEQLQDVVGGTSLVAKEDRGADNVRPEGIVARTIPLLFNRRGDRVMWKLKFKDFWRDAG